MITIIEYLVGTMSLVSNINASTIKDQILLMANDLTFNQKFTV